MKSAGAALSLQRALVPGVDCPQNDFYIVYLESTSFFTSGVYSEKSKQHSNVASQCLKEGINPFPEYTVSPSNCKACQSWYFPTNSRECKNAEVSVFIFPLKRCKETPHSFGFCGFV